MMTVLNIIGWIVALLFMLVLFACTIFVFQYLCWFHWRPCKHCGHNMEYRGLKEDSDNGHYLFHCPKCGAWEQIPREEFLRDCDKSMNPNDIQV